MMMALTDFIGINYKIIGFVIGMIFLISIGWQAHTIYDGYKDNKTANKAIVDSGKAQNAIIDFNQALSKESSNAKDPCYNDPIAPGVRRLLY